MMAKNTLTVIDNRTKKQYDLPIEHGAIQAKDLRLIKLDENDFGLMSYDPAFMNTASCKSTITFIDGDAGILRYRGYPIEQLAERSRDRKSTRLNSSHLGTSYAAFCLKKKTTAAVSSSIVSWFTTPISSAAAMSGWL